MADKIEHCRPPILCYLSLAGTKKLGLIEISNAPLRRHSCAPRPVSVVVRARRDRNASVQLFVLLSSTGTNRLGNGHESWRTRQSSPLAQRQRKKVEALFAELKNQIGLRRLRLRLRRLKFVREQFFLAAAAQNIKRLVRFPSQPTIPTTQAAS